MLIKDKLRLSAVMGIGSVVILLAIILYFNRAESDNAENLKILADISGQFAELDRQFYDFVMSPDSVKGDEFRRNLNRVSGLIGDHIHINNMAIMDSIAINLMKDFENFEQEVISGRYEAGWPATRMELINLRENFVQSRFVLQDLTASTAENQLRSIRLQTLLIATVIFPVLLMAVILILTTSRNLINNISTLLDDTRKIEEGDFEYRTTLNTRDELGSVSASINRVADSLNNARLKEQEYRNELLERTRQVNLLKELAITANRIQNINELYRIVLERIRSYTGWISGHVYEVSGDGMVMNPTEIWSVREGADIGPMRKMTEKMTFMKNEGLIGKVFGTGMPVWVTGINDDPTFLRKKAFLKSGIHSIVAIPIVTEGTTHAVIELHSEHRESPDDDLLDLFRGLGALLSHVLVRERYTSRLNLQTEQLNFALDSAGMYSWSIDLNTMEIQTSRNYRKVLGYTSDRSSSIEEFNRHVHPDDREEAVKAFNDLMQGYKEYSSEFRFQTDTGKELYLWSKGDVIYDADDKPDKVAGIVMDITNRKQIESRLEASEKNYRLLFENCPLPLWIFSAENFRLVDSNAMMQKISGYGKNDLLQYGMADLIHEDHLESVLEIFAEIDTQPFTELETRIKTSEGSYLDILLFASEIRYTDNDCIIATCTDITELKSARKRLLSSIIEGEDRERQRVAVELHDGIGQYLTASNMNLEGLKKDLENISPKKYQQFMNGLVLLNLAIDETRNLAHTLMPKTLKDYGLVISLKSLIDKLKKTAIPDIFFYTRLDEDKLDNQTKINIYRIIQETINNSLKHSKCTKIDVQAVMHERMVVILIEDNGVGFEVKNGHGKDDGIGLLSIKNRVVSMNGNLEIDSVQGRGTSITIEIPLTYSPGKI